MDDIGDGAPRATGMRTIFWGSDGLRAGWSLVLFLLVLAAIFAVIGLLHLAGKPPTAAESAQALVVMKGEAVGFGAIAVSAFLVSLVERRRFGRYGLGNGRLVRDLLVGILWGVATLSLLVGVLVASGGLVFDGLALGGVAALESGAEWALAFLLVGLFEEFLFRGFLQYTLARGVAGIVRAISPGNVRARTIGFWVAAVVLSGGLFAAAHTGNHGETVVGISAVALAGLTLVYALYRTGSLWWAVGWHAGWDWAQSFIFGVADSGQVSAGRLFAMHTAGPAWLSGGSAGPEGSMLVIPTLLLTLVVIHRTLPKRATAFDA